MNGLKSQPSTSMRVGYWLSEKKAKKLNITGFAERMKKSTGIELVLIDLTKCVEEQPLFDVIVHKLSDLMTAADRGDSDASKGVALIEEYIARHPKVVVLDPLPNVRKLLDRDVCYTEIKGISFSVRDIVVCSPSFATGRAVHTSLVNNELTFPVVCKHLTAHGSREAHQMAIVFNEEGFRELGYSFVAQQFINHSGLLYKIFVVGKRHFAVKRPSLKNLTLNRHDKSTIFFHSHDVSKPDSSSELNGIVDPVEDHRQLDDSVVSAIAKEFREKLGLSLFGIDVVIEDESNRHCIIDVNFFPGYEGFCNFEQALQELLDPVIRSGKPANGFVSNGYQKHLAGNGHYLPLPNGILPINGASDLDDLMPRNSMSRSPISVTGQRNPTVNFAVNLPSGPVHT